jgi:uncharacterized protein (TIGR03437 family)
MNAHYTQKALLLLALAKFMPGQLVVNGDFEDVNISPKFFTFDSTQVPGWTRSGSQGDGIAGRVGYSDDQGSVTVAGHGSQFGMLGGGFGGPGSASMTTMVTQLTPGSTYQLSFLIANEGEDITQSITVSFPSGSSTGSTKFSTKQSAGLYWKVWEPQTMQFVATATTAAVQFSVVNQQFDIGLDFVRVTAVVSTPLLQVSPTTLSFTGLTGGDAPAPQDIAILSAGSTAVGYGIVIDGGTANSTAPPWLSVAPLTGNTPARLVVSVNQISLQPGSYSGRIRVTVPANTAANPIDISVSFVVSTGPPKLDVVPNYLSFATRAQSPFTSDQTLLIRNSGGNGPLGFSVAVVSQSPWLSVSAANGQTAPNTATFVHVQANSQGLAVGSYRGLVRLTASTNRFDIPVELFVSDTGPILAVNVTGVRFQSRQNNATPIVQNVKVLNLGDPAATVNWTAQVSSGSPILNLGVTSGTATMASPGVLPLTLAPSSATLAPGGYYALVKVSDPKALNSPQYVVAVLDQDAANSQPKPDPAPQGLAFVAGGVSAPSQSVTINVDNSTAVAFQASASTNNGGTWLFVTPSSGTTSAGAPAQLTVGVNSNGLTPGFYTGDVDIALAGFLRTVNVTLIVTPVGLPSSTRPVEAPLAAGCTPARLALTYTGLVNNFAAPAGWPATLVVRLNDDCGNAITNGSVSTSFSNGDPPLSLRSDQQTGQYSATWQPGFPTAQTTITTRATAGSLQAATMQLIGSVAPNSFSVTVLTPHGTLHNLNPVVGSALAPGTVAQLFGSGLASQTVSPGVLPLVNTFNGTQVIVGGLPAPLYFLSGNQLNVQIPNELRPGQQYAIIASANNAYSLPDTLDLNPVEPGVAAFPDGSVIAQHLDYSLVNNGKPAKPGEPLTIYLAGMGATNPALLSGAQAPSSEPLARATTAPTLLLDGQNADVLFAGLTPGAVGLYQINFTVPTNSRSGNLDLVVIQGVTPSNTTKLLVSQ